MRLSGVGLCLGTLALASACASPTGNTTGGESPDDTAGASEEAPLANLVPAELRDSPLPAAVGYTFPPLYFIDDQGDLVGMTIDLAKEATKLLGIELNMEKAQFDAVIPGLTSGKYQVAITSAEITQERTEIIDMVPYLQNYYTLMQWNTADPIGENLSDICGLTLGGNQGSLTVVEAEEASQEVCVANGLDPVVVKIFPDQQAIQLAARSGRVDATLTGIANALYAQSLTDSWTISGPKFGEAPTGIALPKGSGLTKPFAAAFDEMIENGTYAEILEKWNLSDEGIDKAVVNAPSLESVTSPTTSQ